MEPKSYCVDFLPGVKPTELIFQTESRHSSHFFSPTFETKFARMEYVGDGKFALSFMRHTGQWIELYDAVSVDDCMKAVRDDPWFVP